MKSIYIVTTNGGDGSSYLEWHKTMSPEKQEYLVDKDPECYAGGEGLQYTELKFPDDFDLNKFAEVNYIFWFEDDEYYEDD